MVQLSDVQWCQYQWYTKIFNHVPSGKKTVCSFGVWWLCVCPILQSIEFNSSQTLVIDAKFGAASCGHGDLAILSQTAGSGWTSLATETARSRQEWQYSGKVTQVIHLWDHHWNDEAFIWGFPKMVGFPNKEGFPTKNDHFGVFGGYHHLRKHPYEHMKLTYFVATNLFCYCVKLKCTKCIWLILVIVLVLREFFLKCSSCFCESIFSTLGGDISQGFLQIIFQAQAVAVFLLAEVLLWRSARQGRNGKQFHHGAFTKGGRSSLQEKHSENLISFVTTHAYVLY